MDEDRERLGLPPWRLVVEEAVSAANLLPADLQDEAKAHEVRDIFNPPWHPFGGVDVHQVR